MATPPAAIARLAPARACSAAAWLSMAANGSMVPRTEGIRTSHVFIFGSNVHGHASDGETSTSSSGSASTPSPSAPVPSNSGAISSRLVRLGPPVVGSLRSMLIFMDLPVCPGPA